MTDLSGQTVLVTHTDIPVGAEIARAAVRAGARVLAHYAMHSAKGEALARSLGIRPTDTISADLTIPEHPIALWNAAMDRAHKIDALVNVAGIYRPSFINGGDLAWMESWRRAIQLNLTAPADLCRAASAHFRVNGRAALVNLSCPSPQETGGTLDAAHVAARGGMIALSRTLARAMSAQNTAVYALGPGEGDSALPPEERKGLYDWVRCTPYPTVKSAEEIGELVAMMCDEASPAAAHTLAIEDSALVA